MTETIIKLHDIDKEHLLKVKEGMKELGKPSIKAVWVEAWDAWVALEGTHRITAAEELGYSVKIEEIGYSQETLNSLGIEDADFDVTVEWVVDDAWLAYNNGHFAEVETTIT